jgi:hypothetical protein
VERVHRSQAWLRRASPEPLESPSAPTAKPASGACDNPYFPARQGATWRSTISGGPLGPVDFTDTVIDLSGDQFILTSQFSGLTKTQRWSCRPEGLVALDYGGGAATLSVEGSQAVFDTTAVEGALGDKDRDAAVSVPQPAFDLGLQPARREINSRSAEPQHVKLALALKRQQAGRQAPDARLGLN